MAKDLAGAHAARPGPTAAPQGCPAFRSTRLANEARSHACHRCEVLLDAVTEQTYPLRSRYPDPTEAIVTVVHTSFERMMK